MTWLGHASVLAEVDEYTFLTDPIFSLRASALQQIGKSRSILNQNFSPSIRIHFFRLTG
jgi:L-ascorbate metabolism protein UlaG (beta-lactamase superfamily)